jgi:hypothetical protein
MRSGICSKCGGSDVIRSLPAEYGHNDFERPMTVTAEPRWVMSGRNPHNGRGRLSMYVCRDCGYVEWYVQDPQDIPLGEEYQTARVPPPDVRAAPDQP